MDLIATQLILQDRKIAYIITDRDLKVVEVGGSVNLLYNYDLKQILDGSLLDIAPELIGDEKTLTDILEGRLPRFQLNRVNRATFASETIYLTLVLLPYRGNHGKITGLLYVVEDITRMGVYEQRITQQKNELHLLKDQLARQNTELAAANTELRELDEMKSRFISIAAHEFRTPLTSINGFLEILLEGSYGPLTEAQQQRLQIIKNSAERLATLTRNLLDITRLEAGRVELFLKATNLTELVMDVAAEFIPQFEMKSQGLDFEAPPNLPLALCDEMRIEQIIANLLSNAHKYTPAEGDITIRLQQAETEGFLQLSIRDNGIGISPEEHDKLFTRFFRAKSAILSEETGTGLGLYITQALVELHGGQIWVESELHKGTTFYVTIPMADPSGSTV